MRTNSTAWIVAAGVFLLVLVTVQSKQPASGPGLFAGQTDVGSVVPAGTGGGEERRTVV